MTKLRLYFAIAMVCALACSHWAVAQVLNQVPAQSLVVFKFNHLKLTSQKIAGYVKDIGLGVDAPPEMADPIGSLQKDLKVDKGLDLTGDAALIYIDPAVSMEKDDKSFLLLVPVTNFADFVSNFPDAKIEGGVGETTTKDGTPLFFKQSGKFAALAPSKALVSLKPVGLKTPALSARELAEKDVVIYANIVDLRPLLTTKLTEARTKAMAEMEKKMLSSGKPEDAKGLPLAKATLNQFFNAVDAFIRDADGSSIGLAITPTGLNTTLLADFRADSYLGGMVAKVPNAGGSLLAGLPEGKYLYYGGMSIDGKQMSQLVDDLIAPIAAEVAKIEGAEKINQMVDIVRAMIPATTGGSFGIFAPSGPLGASALLQGVSVTRGDTRILSEQKKKMGALLPELLKASGLEEASKMAFTYTPAAKTVDGVAFDSMNMKFAGEPATPEEAQAAQMMTFMYGPDGPTYLLGKVDDKSMLTTICLDDVSISKAISAAKGGTDPFAQMANVTAVRAALPAKRVVEVYLAVDNLVTSVAGYAAMFGMPFQIKLPPNLPPVGFATATDGPALRMDIHVPTPLVKSLVKTGQDIKKQMQGGPGGPGGPGGGPGGPGMPPADGL